MTASIFFIRSNHDAKNGAEAAVRGRVSRSAATQHGRSRRDKGGRRRPTQSDAGPWRAPLFCAQNAQTTIMRRKGCALALDGLQLARTDGIGRAWSVIVGLWRRPVSQFRRAGVGGLIPAPGEMIKIAAAMASACDPARASLEGLKARPEAGIAERLRARSRR
jgi:hypothetical protein